ncbi:HNH endonuclease signature motif containing protein [Brevibacterium pityocampae]|uniref:HNH domain-containing protein n=1 Tax=Brevibacterium pityocampae TaxID=506594 RepID=A0ABP8JT14_9MICO
MTATRTDPAGARAPDGVPALLRLQDSLPAYDRLMLARMRLIADTVVEECLDLEPEPAPELAAEPMSTSKWVLERMTGEHLTCLAAVLDSTITRAYSTARDALIACFSLHRTRALVETGTMCFDRLQYAARRAHRLGDAALAELDAGIAELRPDLSWKSYCRAVNDLIRLLTDNDDRAEDVHIRRRVEFWRSDPSEGKLLLTGPLEPLYALHRRLEATARAIARAQTGTFGEQLPPGSVIIDDRTVPQLMFDLMSTLAPGTEVEVLNPVDFGRGDPATGTDAGELVDALIRTAGGAADARDAAPPVDPDPASGPGSASADPSRVVITCPTNQEWLRRQATVVVTVPFLSLTGHAELPGHWSDGGPVPAEMAQRFASRSSTFYRILTDPVSGAVCDEAARSYVIPKGTRMTMNEKWMWCTAPGCARRAETCDADHAIPFDHADPAAGGRTDLENLHPLCRAHHLMKTKRMLTLHAGPGGMKRWEFPHGITAEVRAAERIIDRAAAREMLRVLGLPDPSGRAGPENPDDRAGPADPGDRAGPMDPGDQAGPDDHRFCSGPDRSPDSAADRGRPRPAGPPDPWTCRSGADDALWTHADDDPPPF